MDEAYKSTRQKLIDVLTHLYSGDKSLAEQAVSQIGTDTPSLQKDLPVRILKGGTYKIKGYYLEDNDLTDIRGASTLITEVQENIVPNALWEIIGFDPILYNGGGNLLALVPENCPENLGEILEAAAQNILLTAQSAYYVSEPIKLSELLGKEYNQLIAKKETELEQRKKCKLIFEQAPASQFVGKELFSNIRVDAAPVSDAGFCECCKKRIALYHSSKKSVCGGCLHKMAVGKEQKNRYVDKYNARTGANAEAVDSLADIHKDHIALVYADGNNMGGILQNIKDICSMMDFSRFVKSAMENIVFDAIKARDINKFEIVAIGGDDVFILVPGDKAVRLAAEMIRLYQERFSEKFKGTNSTLSVGICIAKNKTPVKVMLETAEEELSAAKNLVKKLGDTKGSLSFRVLDTYEGASADRGSSTLLPYSFENAEKILRYADNFQDKTMKTRLQALSSAFRHADLPEEASLFFRYVNAKETETKRRIKNPPQLNGYKADNGYYTPDNNPSENHYLWDDLLDLIAYGK